jgi:hypothetical protein
VRLSHKQLFVLIAWSIAATVHPAVDWGGGGAVFRDHNGATLEAANSVAVLISRHEGNLVDFENIVPPCPSDLVTPGKLLVGRDGNKAVVLAVIEGFTFGFLLNSVVPNISQAVQQDNGADLDEPLVMVIWDQNTFVDGAPSGGSRFVVVPLFIGGDAGSPAKTYGNLPPNLPLAAKPDDTIAEFRTLSEYRSEYRPVNGVRLFAGWNFVSVPLRPDAATPGDVFGDGTSAPGWEWLSAQQRYIGIDTVVARVGYWVHTDTAAEIEIPGTVEAQNTLNLTAHRWHAVGVLAPVEAPAAVVWHWDALLQKFRIVCDGELLLPWRGYWIWPFADMIMDLE